jgi:hypothetical protein
MAAWGRCGAGGGFLVGFSDAHQCSGSARVRSEPDLASGECRRTETSIASADSSPNVPSRASAFWMRSLRDPSSCQKALERLAHQPRKPLLAALGCQFQEPGALGIRDLGRCPHAPKIIYMHMHVKMTPSVGPGPGAVVATPSPRSSSSAWSTPTASPSTFRSPASAVAAARLAAIR